jgi:hypothetical protein
MRHPSTPKPGLRMRHPRTPPEPGGFTEGSQGVALTGPAPPLDPAPRIPPHPEGGARTSNCGMNPRESLRPVTGRAINGVKGAHSHIESLRFGFADGARRDRSKLLTHSAHFAISVLDAAQAPRSRPGCHLPPDEPRPSSREDFPR